MNDLIALFQQSHEFQEIQYDNKLDLAAITNLELWQSMLDSVMRCVSECLVAKKTMLASKQKTLSKRLEEVLGTFVDANYTTFEVEKSEHHLPFHMKGVFHFHATNFVRITKREMCHNVTDGGR